MIATPNVAMQFEDRVTEKGRERSYATGYRSDSVAYRDIRFFCNKLDEVLIRITLCRMSLKRENDEWRELSLLPPVIKSKNSL